MARLSATRRAISQCILLTARPTPMFNGRMDRGVPEPVNDSETLAS